MSLLRPARIERAAEVDVSSVLGREPGPMSNSGGQVVNPDQAMRLSQVWACIDLICELIAQMPVSAERSRGGVSQTVPTPAVLTSPSANVRRSGWVRQVLTSLLLRGNAWGEITARTRDGYPRFVEMLHPDDVWVDLTSDHRSIARVHVRDRNGRRDVPLDRLWHVTAFEVPGHALGLSPISYAAETIGLGLAAQRFGANWFGDGAHPSGVLQSDQQIDKPVADVIKTRFREAVGRKREPVVLGAGLEWKPIQIAPEESQFLETTQANISAITRYFRIAPENIGGDSGSSMTYANVEQRDLGLLTRTIAPWVFRMEEAQSDLMPAGTRALIGEQALLRADTKSRFEAHASAIGAGWKSVDEVRAEEGLAPLEVSDG